MNVKCSEEYSDLRSQSQKNVENDIKGSFIICVIGKDVALLIYEVTRRSIPESRHNLCTTFEIHSLK